MNLYISHFSDGVLILRYINKMGTNGGGGVVVMCAPGWWWCPRRGGGGVRAGGVAVCAPGWWWCARCDDCKPYCPGLKSQPDANLFFR